MEANRSGDATSSPPDASATPHQRSDTLTHKHGATSNGKGHSNGSTGQDINSLAKLASILHPSNIDGPPSSVDTKPLLGGSRRGSLGASEDDEDEDPDDPADARPESAPSKKRKNSQITVEELEDVERTVDEKEKRRKLRLLKNRQSAALSRQRKKEYIGNLEKRLDEVSHEKVEVQGRLTTAMSENRDAKSTIASLSSQITSLQDENTRLRGQVSAAAADAAMKETIRLTTAAEHAKALREASLGFANALAPTTTSTTATEETPPPSAPEPPAATPSEESNPNT